MSRSLRFYGILVAATIALTGLAVHTEHTEQSAARHLSTVQADDGEGGDGLIWD